jgi:hypothetical protein
MGGKTREVEKDFYGFTVLSADETIKHWEAAVDAGKTIFWDVLSRAMEQIASETMNKYGESLEETERIMVQALNAQFDASKQDKETRLAEARAVQRDIQIEAEKLFGLQSAITESDDKP